MNTIEQMSSHIENTAAYSGVKVVYYTGVGRAVKAGGAMWIHIRPVKGLSTYFMALHELGHCVARGRGARKLEREANCWKWAIDMAIREPTPAVRRMISKALQSYLDAGRRNHGRRQGMIEPAEDHIFWQLLREEYPQ